MLCHVIVQVTAMHSHVGTLAEFYSNPAFCASKWFSGELHARPQGALQVACITHVTSMKQIGLTEASWADSFLLDADAEIGARRRRLALQFIAALEDLSDEIDELNRHAPWPYHKFNPRHLETSIAK